MVQEVDGARQAFWTLLRKGVSEQQPDGVFSPPVDIVRILSRSITSHVSPGGFLYT